ncbi:MAG: NAD-dependent epimerase/dehydratase family protein [Deltaproteobacteria bacterium]|nr:NAD-dependent epimerase/dehydratase family protein [Deltaproteobacteria bacterium]MBN2674237.1 NAD-dependent epimerase/dehydratase family protein [Deltaproteobacteria bacterium]
MKILVTGGAGFIGSHLCERLLGRGHQVVCLDNFNNFYDPKIKRDNILTALKSPDYTLVEGDILNTKLLDTLFETPFDAVVHLAAYAGVRPSIQDPQLYQKVNLEGTVNLLEQCRRHDIRKFVFASSSSVYGGRTEVPFRESDNIMHPISPYAATKAAGEAICYSFHHLFGIHMHLLRFFTVYGPRQRPEMAIHLFARQMLENQPIKMFGNGESCRDYTYIDDIIDGVTASTENCNGFEVLNLGGSRTTSLKQLIELIANGLNITPIIDQLPNQAGDVPITFADVSKAQRIIGYAPKVPIEEGMRRFCRWLLEKHV